MNDQPNNDSQPGCAAIFLFVIPLFGFATGTIRDGFDSFILISVNDRVTTVASATTTGSRTRPTRYEFIVNGRAYNGRSRQENVGDKINVVYDPDKPSLNRPKEYLFQDIAWAAGCLLLLSISIATPIVLWAKQQSLDQMSQTNE